MAKVCDLRNSDLKDPIDLRTGQLIVILEQLDRRNSFQMLIVFVGRHVVGVEVAVPHIGVPAT